MVCFRGLYALLFATLVAAVSPAMAEGLIEGKAVPETQDQVQLSFAPLVKKTASAVVNIYTAKTVNTRQVSPLFNDPFFRRFFGEQALTAPGPKRKVQNALGSGVIIAADGVIVTNNHVIEGADEIKVVLNDRREFGARVVGRDERTDLAVLKLDMQGEKLPFLELSDSDAVEVGDLVLAIGNPFGVGQTVTSGIVSALARNNVGVSDLNSFIQTDAAINPGNSGGALINVSGRLVGVNTAIFSKSGGSHGIGFAIPSNMVDHVVKSLLTSGNVVRPWWGAAGQDVTADIAGALGMDRPLGVMVTSVYPKGPAERAGLKVGDVIVAINNRETANAQDLRFRIATQSVGGTAEVKVMRQGGVVVLPLAMEAPPEIPPRDKTLLRGAHPFGGSVVANLSPALADEVGLPHGVTGVIILELDSSGSAIRLGFEPGDIIRKLNGETVQTVDHLQSLIKTPASGWLIAIERGGQDLNLVIR
ncbi:MAG: DegQ family serine endoprotease [Rhodospirillales bacterium]|nr:DegQ family serine endoprotease [Rhodospirillales bacterium]